MSNENASAPVADESASDSSEGQENTENQENTDEGLNADASGEEGGEPAFQEPEFIEDKSKKKDTKAKTEVKKEEKKSNKKNLKLKVDGKEEDYELDLDNEEELRKNLQLSRVAQKRMAEMAAMKKDVTDLIQRLNKDPLSFLADAENGMGMNVEDLVKGYVEKRLADAEKSPEQLKAEANERKLQQIMAEREAEKSERERERYESQLQGEIIKYDNMITKTLENSEFKKPSPYIVKKMSDYLILGVENGIDVTTDDLLPLVREEIQSEIKELINSAPEEVIDAMFGKEIFNRMRKRNVANAKQAKPVHASAIKDTGNKETKPVKEADKMSYKTFFKF